MAEEKRGRRTYYYEKKRVGGRVVSIYIGTGDKAASHLAVQALVRAERAAEREIERQWQEADEALEAALVAAMEFSHLLTEAALLASGCYQHHRQWRKRRGIKRTDTK
jgi:hypothetical protein